MNIKRPTLRAYVRRNLKMSKGKQSAQCMHASQALLKKEYVLEYARCVVLEASDVEFEVIKKEHPDCVVIRDTGKTEVEPGSETVLAYWSWEAEDAEGKFDKEASESTQEKPAKVERNPVARKSGDT